MKFSIKDFFIFWSVVICFNKSNVARTLVYHDILRYSRFSLSQVLSSISNSSLDRLKVSSNCELSFTCISNFSSKIFETLLMFLSLRQTFPRYLQNGTAFCFPAFKGYQGTCYVIL